MSRRFGISILLVLLTATPVFAQTYEPVPGFPSPAPGSFSVTGVGLPDGRLVVWNGDSVFLQALSGWNRFERIATGYAGDPAFMDLAPDGTTLLLGAGFSGKLYLLDVNNPVDYAPGSEAYTISHYSGRFLTQDLVVLDRFKDDWSTDELGVLSLNGTPEYRAVMDKPAVEDIPPDTGAASAHLAVDASRQNVYTMAYIYDFGTWAVVSNQLKRIPASALIDAFNESSTLDWNTVGTAIGGPTDFNDSGPVAVTQEGYLAIGGFGSAQLVDPASETVVATYAPAGFEYYSVIHNQSTNDIVLVADGVAWAPSEDFASVPVAGAAGLTALAVALAFAGRRLFTT